MWCVCTHARYGNNPDMETVPDGTQRHCKNSNTPPQLERSPNVCVNIWLCCWYVCL